MKNIVIVNGYLQIGGAEKVLVYLANLFSSKYNVYFIVLEKTQKELFKLDDKVKLIELDLEDKRISSRDMGIIGAIKYFIQNAVLLKSKFKELNADAVIAFNDREIIITWISLLFQSKIKCIFSQRNAPSSKRSITNKILRFIYSHSDGVAFQLDSVRDFYGLPNSSKYSVIENPIRLVKDVPYFEQPTKRILAAGRLNHQKRFDLLIDAFAIFSDRHKDYTLEIYGEGSQKDFLNNLIKEKKLDDKVFIKSPIPSVTINKSDSTMFVLCSDYEGIPNIVLEAMSCGIPCIVTDCDPGGGRLVTNNGECGILVATNDVNALANAMHLYANDSSIRFEKREKALSYIRHFEEDVISKKWIDYLERIM